MSTVNNPTTFREIRDLLEIATHRNELSWQSTPDDEVYRAPIRGGYVWFARFPEVPPGVFSPDATPGRFTITLMDDNDKVLERYYALAPVDVVEAARLFGEVRRKVKGLAQFYDNMLNDLRRKANQPS
jgi:hypothetical protein